MRVDTVNTRDEVNTRFWSSFEESRGSEKNYVNHKRQNYSIIASDILLCTSGESAERMKIRSSQEGGLLSASSPPPFRII